MNVPPNTSFRPVEPQPSWIEQFFVPTLLASKSYHLDAPQVKVKLDQNESPIDWPVEFKDRVAELLKARSWNRYPAPYPTDLAQKVAIYAGVGSHEQILLGPGSNYLITLVMDALCKKRVGDVVIARPSFPLYESHAQYSGVPYLTWNLSADLEFDLGAMPTLRPGSVVFFASPNNPVGNSLSSRDLEGLLANYPHSLFVADEAYFEFTNDPYTPLLAEHGNLLILRTFSKALGAAGVRLGYAMGSKALLDQIRKLRLPYLINQFGLVAANLVMDNREIALFFAKTVEGIRAERHRVYESLLPLGKKGGFKVKPTQANFLLLRWPTTSASDVVYERLVQEGILVRNVSGAPAMAGCLRVTVSQAAENDQFLRALEKAIA